MRHSIIIDMDEIYLRCHGHEGGKKHPNCDQREQSANLERILNNQNKPQNEQDEEDFQLGASLTRTRKRRKRPTTEIMTYPSALSIFMKSVILLLVTISNLSQQTRQELEPQIAITNQTSATTNNKPTTDDWLVQQVESGRASRLERRVNTRGSLKGDHQLEVGGEYVLYRPANDFARRPSLEEIFEQIQLDNVINLIENHFYQLVEEQQQQQGAEWFNSPSREEKGVATAPLVANNTKPLKRVHRAKRGLFHQVRADKDFDNEVEFLATPPTTTTTTTTTNTPHNETHLELRHTAPTDNSTTRRRARRREMAPTGQPAVIANSKGLMDPPEATHDSSQQAGGLDEPLPSGSDEQDPVQGTTANVLEAANEQAAQRPASTDDLQNQWDTVAVGAPTITEQQLTGSDILDADLKQRKPVRQSSQDRLAKLVAAGAAYPQQNLAANKLPPPEQPTTESGESYYDTNVDDQNVTLPHVGDLQYALDPQQTLNGGGRKPPTGSDTGSEQGDLLSTEKELKRLIELSKAMLAGEDNQQSSKRQAKRGVTASQLNYDNQNLAPAYGGHPLPEAYLDSQRRQPALSLRTTAPYVGGGEANSFGSISPMSQRSLMHMMQQAQNHSTTGTMEPAQAPSGQFSQHNDPLQSQHPHHHLGPHSMNRRPGRLNYKSVPSASTQTGFNQQMFADNFYNQKKASRPVQFRLPAVDQLGPAEKRPNRKLRASGSQRLANFMPATPVGDNNSPGLMVDSATVPHDPYGLMQTGQQYFAQQQQQQQPGFSTNLNQFLSYLRTGSPVSSLTMTPQQQSLLGPLGNNYWPMTTTQQPNLLNNALRQPTATLPWQKQLNPGVTPTPVAYLPLRPTNRLGIAYTKPQVSTKRHMTAGGGARDLRGTDFGSQMSASSVNAAAAATNDPMWSDSRNQEDEYQQSPQTIQITAVPNGLVGNGFNGFNGFNGVNGWNGLNGGWGGPWNGRQVLLVNRQPGVGSEWRNWALPIAIILALPLVLGALFVPVFLKSVMFLIQILQMLGLLMPPHQLAGHLTGSHSSSSSASG